MISRFILVFAVLLSGGVVHAEMMCREFGDYVVENMRPVNSKGETILVYKKTKTLKNCDVRDNAKPVFKYEPGKDVANDGFGILQGNYLTVTQGDDLGANTSKIFDLKTGKLVMTWPGLVSRFEGDFFFSTAKVKETSLGSREAPQGCIKGLETKLRQWADAKKLKTKFKLADCECEKFFKETGNAVATAEQKISLKTKKSEYTGHAACEFYE